MTVKNLNKRLRRGFSFRSSSSGSDPSASASPSFRRWNTWSPGTADTSDVIAEIDPTIQALAISAADEKKTSFRESLPQSLIQAHGARDCLAPFRKEEIVFGPKLGAGEFSNVYEVQSFQCQPLRAALSVEEVDQRLHMKNNEKYRETENARYALKHIKEEYYQNHDAESYIQASSDLALEAEILASLQHPNIIKLRGITYSGAAGIADGPSGYFLVIDRLFETLDQRIRKWRVPRVSSFREKLSRMPRINALKKSLSEPKIDEKEVMDERLSIVLQISAAMVYMHKHSIIFRDLKPENIGFDVRGDVKIFDFGMARIMPENGEPNTDVFEMSCAGTPRYMAPECLSGNHYNLKADVYTFAIILWEVLSGQTPYAFVRRRHQLTDYVVEENGRPVIEESWPSDIQDMLERSFDPEIENRPKMTLWYTVIRNTLASLRGGDMAGLEDSWITRRRSHGSMAMPKNIVPHEKLVLELEALNENDSESSGSTN